MRGLQSQLLAVAGHYKTQSHPMDAILNDKANSVQFHPMTKHMKASQLQRIMIWLMKLPSLNATLYFPAATPATTAATADCMMLSLFVSDWHEENVWRKCLNNMEVIQNHAWKIQLMFKFNEFNITNEKKQPKPPHTNTRKIRGLWPSASPAVEKKLVSAL